jgi:hypothetical protein
MKCAPGAAEADCVDQFIRNFGKRALRRPLTAEEVTKYKTLFTKGRGTGTLASGISLVISAFLQSPYFLYKVELASRGPPATRSPSGSTRSAPAWPTSSPTAPPTMRCWRRRMPAS